MGSGTVLCEDGRCGYAAFGSEINPAAFKMASTYTLINTKPAERRRAVLDRYAERELTKWTHPRKRHRG